LAEAADLTVIVTPPNVRSLPGATAVSFSVE
jgi:hypothetical protein